VAAQFVVPEYHSLPGASKRLFLDFDGHDMAVVGSTKAVTGAANNGSGLIRLTVPGHGLSAGHSVLVTGVGGVPNANGTWWTIQIVNLNTIDLTGSSFAGAYTSGGSLKRVEKWDGAEVGELVPGSNPKKFALPTVPFSLDADSTKLNAQELAYIEAAWRLAAEDFAPFNVDVTTKEPSNWSDATDFRVVFDDHAGNAAKGDWWTSDYAGGRAIIGSFGTTAPNVAFMWHQYYTLDGQHSSLLPKILGDGASHEAGHGYGLQHNYLLNGGNIYASSVGLIMVGSGAPPGYRERHVWTSGKNVSGNDQDELAILSTALGYRSDDHGATVATGTTGSQSGSKCWASGVIGQMNDVDVIRFTLGSSGLATFNVNVIPQVQPNVPGIGTGDVYYANLDAKLTLLDSAGNPAVDALGSPVPVASPTGDSLLGYSPRITARLNSGIYGLKIESAGLYGSVGQYTVAGAIPHPTPSTAVPQVTGVVVRNSAYPAKAYAIPTGTGIQLRSAPVGGVNQITISFSEAVSVQQDDLILKRGAGSGATVAFTGFSYDAATFSATWTFATFHTDQLLLTLKGTGVGAVVDAQSNALDGEWTNPASMGQSSPTTSVFPSGNVSAGGDFVFRLTLLGGDLDCDGDVDDRDSSKLLDNFGEGTTWAEGDCDGDGDIDLSDFGIMKSNYDAGTNYRNWP
jgi:hypothetical protein